MHLLAPALVLEPLFSSGCNSIILFQPQQTDSVEPFLDKHFTDSNRFPQAMSDQTSDGDRRQFHLIKLAWEAIKTISPRIVRSAVRMCEEISFLSTSGGGSLCLALVPLFCPHHHHTGNYLRNVTGAGALWIGDGFQGRIKMKCV